MAEAIRYALVPWPGLYRFFKDVLERITNGHPMSRIDDLLPWNWMPSAVAE